MDPAEYFDATAEFYDAQYGDDQGGDRAFYRDLAVEADGPVLEVGCGTGRIYLDLLRAGVDADGIDVSEGMLDVLREKADEAGLEPSVWRADVTEFDPPRAYALAVVPFRAFLHLLSVEAQLAALSNLHDALAPGGRLALNFFAPDLDVIAERYGSWQEETVQHGGESYTLRTYTELVDPVEQVARERRELYDADGERVFAESFELKLLPKREFELLARLSPFEEWTAYGGFDREPLESSDQEQVWVLRK